MAAIVAGLLIIALMVVPVSPAALSGVEWAITIAWIVVGFVILAVFGRGVAGKKLAGSAGAAGTNTH